MKVLLFSGGIESTCLALIERPDLAINIDYGQVCADGENGAASHLSGLLSLPFRHVRVPMSHLGSGELTGVPQPVGSRVPEHWPFRNQMLISIAAMAVAAHEACEILIGTVAGDEVHADGTAEFIDVMDRVLKVQRPAFSLRAPALKMSTIELVKSSGASRDLLGWTLSCHRGNVACGRCRGCSKTVELFKVLSSSSAT